MSTYHPSFGSSGGGIGSVFKSITKSFKQSSSTKRVPVTINPTVVGGGQDLQNLIDQLQTSSSSSVKLQAIKKLIESIQNYLISSVPEIWYVARNNCDIKIIKHSRDLRRATLELLNACIEKDDLTSVGTRIRYFNDIFKNCMFQDNNNNNKFDPDFDLFLKALLVLTDEGRDIHDFIIYEDRNNLYIFLENCLTAAVELLALYKFQTDTKDIEIKENDKKFANIYGVIEFTRNCIKFNYTVFSEGMIIWIINKIIETKSDNKLILLAIIDIINSLSIYGQAPKQCIPQMIKFLATIYGLSLDNSLSLSVWNCVKNLCHDHNYRDIMNSLCDNIHSSDINLYKIDVVEGIKPVYACTGSIKLIRNFQVQSGLSRNENIFEILQVQILNSFKMALNFGINIINSVFLDCIDRLLAKDLYLDNFGVSFNDSIDKIFPFQLWYSSSNSMYDIFNLLKVETEQDKSCFQSICISLQSLYESQELFTPKDKLINFFTNYIEYLPLNTIIFVLQYYSDSKMCSLLNPFWRENSMKLLNHFYFPSDIDVTVKMRCIQVILDAYNTSVAIFNDNDIKYEIILEIAKRSLRETNEELLRYLINNLFGVVFLKCPNPVFIQLMTVFLPLFQPQIPPPPKSLHLVFEGLITLSFVTSTRVLGTVQEHGSIEFTEAITKLLCTTFIKATPERAQECYNFLLQIANLSKHNCNILLIIAKCLVRIRTTTENYIYFTQPSDMAGLALAFRRDNSTTCSGNTNVLWVYPETVDYLPEELFDSPNRSLLLSRVDDGNVDDLGSDKYYIDIQKWLQLILFIMNQYIDWEIYSYVWAHFVSQLSNTQLFYDCDLEINELRKIICHQLTLNLPTNLKLPHKTTTTTTTAAATTTNVNVEVTKADLQVVFVRSLSSLTGYFNKFTKPDQDQIVNSLIFGLGSWDKTAVPCINILTVCCYEIPLSIKKYLNSILTKLQTRITSANAAAHSLEFLISLSQLPNLTTNFTIEDFKQGFGIAFKYIQYAIDLEKRSHQQQQQQQQGHLQLAQIIQQHGVDADVEETPLTQQQTITPILSEYILMLSYHIIASWFVTLRMSDRVELQQFIIKNLKLCSEINENLRDQTIGFLDFIKKFTSSDLPLEMRLPGNNNNKRSSSNTTTTNTSICNRWMVDNLVVSIETEPFGGDTELIIRKPTGISKFNITLDHPSSLNNTSPMVLPNYFLLQLVESNTDPILIPDDVNTNRAISVLDRIPSVEFHKIGIIYIGKNQITENEVLNNKIGSIDYQKFLSNIGDLIKLQGCKSIYTGGLDTDNNIDGEFTRYWRGKYIQIIFHVATMMNNNEQILGKDQNDELSDMDIQRMIDLKKRHIGNNHVNIFFDESGHEFNFNLIKSQFNFLCIVITPHTYSQDYYNNNLPVSSTEDKKQQLSEKYFKVKMYRRGGVPSFCGISHFKLISEKELPVFIRSTSLLASIFANVWHGSKNVWSQRVKQLKLISSYTLPQLNSTTAGAV